MEDQVTVEPTKKHIVDDRNEEDSFMFKYDDQGRMKANGEADKMQQKDQRLDQSTDKITFVC